MQLSVYAPGKKGMEDLADLIDVINHTNKNEELCITGQVEPPENGKEGIHLIAVKREERRELFESMKTRPFWHYCEVCGKKEYLTAQEAFDSGWDYPPNFGFFGVLSPRTCGECGIDKTLWWKITTTQNVPIVVEDSLSESELRTWRRIIAEPESLLEEEGD